MVDLTRRMGLAAAAAAAMCAVIGSTAQAGVFSSLSPETTGSVHFYANDGIGDSVGATVEYAVFTPGTYTHTDPSGGQEYVYAYRITADPVISTTYGPDTFSVGLAYDHTAHRNVSGAHNATDDSTFGSFTAASVNVGPTSFVASFLSTPDNQLDPGTASDVVLFTSPHNYTFFPATISDGGLGQTLALPSPAPEPASLALIMGLAVPALMRRRQR